MQINPRPFNPYFDHDAVRDLSMFFGRQRELHLLYEAIAKHQSVSIVGGRHIGKSSLLQFLGVPDLQQRSGFSLQLQKHMFILTDWRAYLQKKREDFFHLVCEKITAQSRSFLAHLPSTGSGVDRFRRLLEELHQVDYHPVLLMDAFDRVTSNTEFDPRFFSFLRSLAGVDDLISYVTATIKPLHQVCHSKEVAQSPFFNIFFTCPLGPLTLEEANALILSPTQDVHCAFTPEERDWLLRLAGRHPFFLQVACRCLFEEKLAHPHGAPDLNSVQQTIYQELLPHFERAWEDLEEDQRARLKWEVFQTDQPRRHLLELSESSLFRRRVREMSQGDLSNLSLKDVKDALDHLEDTKFLGESKLGELQTIAVQIEGNAPEASSRRGVLVRNLLKAAFEQMKPGGLRSDSALEWRLYNILWYHYFKYHLPNPHTAARLQISSLRQFYREQDRALQALLKEIMDIETRTLNRME